MGARVLLSLILGVGVGIIVAGLVGIPRLVGPANVRDFIANGFTFWGVVSGAPAAVVASGLVFAFLNRRDRNKSRSGRVMAGIVLGIFAIATIWWIVMWGFSPFTLEGLWIYPLAILSAVGALLLVRRPRRGDWDEPPRP